MHDVIGLVGVISHVFAAVGPVKGAVAATSA